MVLKVAGHPAVYKDHIFGEIVNQFMPPKYLRVSDDHIVLDLVFSHPELVVVSSDLMNWSHAPKGWCHAVFQNVRKLRFDEDIDSGQLNGLARLCALEELTINSRNVTDVSALAGLTRLEHLDLGHTLVSDVSALAGLTRLEHLNILISSAQEYQL